MTSNEGLRLFENWSLSTNYDDNSLVEYETHLHYSQGEERGIEEGRVGDIWTKVKVGRGEVQSYQG